MPLATQLLAISRCLLSRSGFTSVGRAFLATTGIIHPVKSSLFNSCRKVITNGMLFSDTPDSVVLDSTRSPSTIPIFIFLLVTFSSVKFFLSFYDMGSLSKVEKSVQRQYQKPTHKRL